MSAFDLAMSKVFGKDWKSTFSAYLTIFFTVGGGITTYLAGVPHPKPWELSVSAVLTTSVGIAKLIVGHLTQDAGSTLADVPGVVQPVPVPSHENPDDPQYTVAAK